MIQRPNISSQVRDELRRRIVNGAAAPRTRLNEVHLARDLAVSRTPLREALCGLVAEGLVDEIPRRGFFVAALSVEEVRQLYVIRRLLDPEALRLGGIPSRTTLKQLRQLNRQIGAESDPERIVDLDDDWHLLLVDHCPSRILIDLIRQFMVRTRRYEWAYMSESGNVSVAIEEHRRILAALGRGDLDAACTALLNNMTSSEPQLIAWLENRQSQEPGA